MNWSSSIHIHEIRVELDANALTGKREEAARGVVRKLVGTYGRHVHAERQRWTIALGNPWHRYILFQLRSWSSN